MVRLIETSPSPAQERGIFQMRMTIKIVKLVLSNYNLTLLFFVWRKWFGLGWLLLNERHSKDKRIASCLVIFDCVVLLTASVLCHSFIMFDSEINCLT